MTPSANPCSAASRETRAPSAGASVASEVAADDGTRKLLLSLADGLQIECVLIPHPEKGTFLFSGQAPVALAKTAGPEKGTFLFSGQAPVALAKTAGPEKRSVPFSEKRGTVPFFEKRVEKGDSPQGRAASSGRTTLCLSTQVGCGHGCVFCATGRMGLKRNLSADEILAQVVLARQSAAPAHLPPVRNLVLMGMGEPADNLDAVREALRTLTDPRGFGFARSKVMVSTIGPTSAAFDELGRMDAVLAWSLHAAEDGLRRRLVPRARHSTADLRAALIAALARRKPALRVLMIEVTLIHGLNDRPEDADALAEFLAPFAPLYARFPKVCVDLIPMNSAAGGSGLRRSPPERVLAFQQRLRARGVFCTVRATRGDDVAAACGQLATRAPAHQEERTR
jgi:23S rRNA (adenine2503-C2)-methyltransferase